jgi:hypothetical protein
MKYYAVDIESSIGEYSHVQTVLFDLPDHVQNAHLHDHLDEYMRDFHGDFTHVDSDGNYYYQNGHVQAWIIADKRITEEEYNVLNRFI